MGGQAVEHFEVIIVGGGIVGAGILRDLSLHQVPTLLLERGDFNSQTSQSSSKMLHGGIRYLENFDFALVWEALHEKNHWVKTVPHLAKERYFYLPVYKESKYPLWMVRIGLFIYDLLSWFKNSPSSSMGAKATLQHLPGLKPEGLKGAGIYSDAVIDDAKLGLECIYDALENSQCQALNYFKVIRQQRDAQGMYQVTAENTLTKEQRHFSCKHLVFATGPFTDQVLAELEIPWKPRILLSKGSHIWLKQDSLPIREPMVLQTKDLRIIFVIPQRHAILVGTTEVALDSKKDIFNIQASDQEIEYLLENVNQYFPNAKVGLEHVLSSFAGVRPLVQEKGASNQHKTSRKHVTLQPSPNVHVIIGGKYTTFRVMAQDVANKIVKQLGKSYNKKLTLAPLRRTSVVDNIHNANLTPEVIDQIIQKEMPKTSEDILQRRLSAPSLEHCLDPQKVQQLLQQSESELKKD